LEAIKFGCPLFNHLQAEQDRRLTDIFYFSLEGIQRAIDDPYQFDHKSRITGDKVGYFVNRNIVPTHLR
jgi:hypothetical protein